MAWVVAIAVAAAYLINKKLQMDHELERAVTDFNAAAKPDDTLPSSEIRKVQRSADNATLQADYNMADLDVSDVQKLNQLQQGASSGVQAYEADPRLSEIEGVYLTRDNFGA